MMFNSTGLFRGIACPRDTDCTLPNCIFLHAPAENIASKHVPLASVSTDAIGIPEQHEPSRKRRRLTRSDDHPVEGTREVESTPVATGSRTALDNASVATEMLEDPSAVKQSVLKSQRSISARPRTVDPTVSAPAKISSKDSTKGQNGAIQPTREKSRIGNKSTDIERVSLTPRLLTPNPAPHPVRLAILKNIHEQIVRLNDEAENDQTTRRELVLSANEIVNMAVDEEAKAGKQNPQIYKNIIGHRILRLKKMKLEEWKSFLLEAFQDKYLPSQSSSTPGEKSFQTGLSAKEEIALLTHISTPLTGLEGHGYVTTTPTSEEVKSALQGVEAAAGFERCERCGTRFQVFPGRNTDEKSRYFGRLTSTEKGCAYHWAKLFRPPKSSSTGGGEQESYHPCCRGVIGSKGCTEATDHVFKVSEVKRLASILQFKHTPESEDSGLLPDGPIAFDCEMGYTTLGLELIRLTAVSWPQNRRLLDVLVRPLGEVIDYNTRFSGVAQEHFSNGLAYGSKGTADSNATVSDQEPLRIVESPVAARDLLFELLTPETPLIGHAIDNDLNACRIIHPSIVDTVLLFPHPRGLPIRYGLKMLSGKHLGRSIQRTGGPTTGHDSMEDATATGDLVRFKVLEKWKKMKLQGWKFQDQKLLSPTNHPPPLPPGRQSAPKPGQGGKKSLKRLKDASADLSITG